MPTPCIPISIRRSPSPAPYTLHPKRFLDWVIGFIEFFGFIGLVEFIASPSLIAFPVCLLPFAVSHSLIAFSLSITPCTLYLKFVPFLPPFAVRLLPFPYTLHSIPYTGLSSALSFQPLPPFTLNPFPLHLTPYTLYPFYPFAINRSPFAVCRSLIYFKNVIVKYGQIPYNYK
jgi:hypothetical protein